ncbi:MAG TPA: M3 family metallopeptidase [Kofleriaceae bacterium]|nr:M3 family metallopeptidase [Kofleriaceae bacterium]
MRKLSVLFVLLAACGGSSKPPVVAQPEPPPTPPTPPSEPPNEKPPTPEPPPAKPEEPVVSDAQWLSDCRALIQQAQAQRQAVLDVKDKRTIENTFVTFNEMHRFANNAAELAGLTSEVHPNAKVRDAARTCTREHSAFIAELMLDKRLYDALAAVDVSKADPATKRFAKVWLRDFKRAGVTLDDKKRARIKQLADEITTVESDIQKNTAEDTRFIEITDKARLDGMPADWIAAHKPDDKGAIKVTTDYPDVYPFLTYANDDELRKQLYVKFRSRGDDKNEPLLGKLFTLRAEKAKLLGFKDWADYQSDDKMLRGGKAAQQFIDKISALADKRAKQDMAELLEALKKRDPKATKVGDWQWLYLQNLVKKDKYAVDASLVRNYFPFEQTLAGLLAITSQIYDVQYQPVADAKPWHRDVKVYDVMRKGEKLGRIYLDMHPRADKYKHAAMFPMQDGVIGKQLPEAALVCNFPDPKVDKGPALMEHADVVTMFHEFGHLMHHVFGGNQRWVSQSGVATEADFVEAPSQMFEEWGWSHETLSKFAKHHETGEVIKPELVEKMQKARKFGAGLYTKQQMFYAAMSLWYHQRDPKKLDQLAVAKQAQAKYSPFPYTEGTKFHTSFGHLVGYSSMYYTYMWSLVIAKDLLTAFEKKGLLDTDTTFKYRDRIMAAGGTKDAADLVKDFLGRKYDFKAYERYLAD